MAETFDFPINPGSFQTTVTPGSGSAGFSSRALVFADANGALTNNSSGPIWDTTQGSLVLGATDPSTFGTTVAPLMVQQPSSAAYGLVVRRFTSAGVNPIVMLTSVNGQAFAIGFNGNAAMGDGTTGQPGVSFISDADNGMMRVGTNDVALVGGGAKMIEFTSNQLGFFGAAPAVRASSYTPSASTATRTVPTTVTTGTQTTVQVLALQNAVNDLISVVNNLVADNKSWGFTP